VYVVQEIKTLAWNYLTKFNASQNVLNQTNTLKKEPCKRQKLILRENVHFPVQHLFSEHIFKWSILQVLYKIHLTKLSRCPVMSGSTKGSQCSMNFVCSTMRGKDKFKTHQMLNNCFNYQPKGSDADTQYYWLPYWATSPPHFSEDERKFWQNVQATLM